MSFGVVVNCLLIFFITVVNGMPQRDDTSQEKPESPSFLQFTNGGIRVNFGGFHAEVGLGGDGTDGRSGLYASAGTPWGAHAGAGLGGQLGKNGKLGGGLYARAGLGHGLPEAAAGLGGRLDGSGRSANPIAGGLYAGATPGGGLGKGVFLGGGVDQAGSDGIISGSAVNEGSLNPPASAAAGTTTTTPASADTANETKPKGRTNIQIIPSKARKEKEKQKLVEADATLRADASAVEKIELQDKETRRAVPPTAEIGLIKSVYVEAAPAVLPAAPATSAAAAPAQGTGQATATVDADTTIVNNPKVVAPQHVHSRWHFRKRFWGPRKTVYVSPAADTESSPSDVVDKLYFNAVFVR